MSTSEIKSLYWEVETPDDYDYYQADLFNVDSMGTLWIQRVVDRDKPLEGHEVIGCYVKGAWMSFRQVTEDFYNKDRDEQYV